MLLCRHEGPRLARNPDPELAQALARKPTCLKFRSLRAGRDEAHLPMRHALGLGLREVVDGLENATFAIRTETPILENGHQLPDPHLLPRVDLGGEDIRWGGEADDMRDAQSRHIEDLRPRTARSQLELWQPTCLSN